MTAHRPELVDAVRVVREVLADVNPGRASDDARLDAEIDVDVLFVVASAVYVVELVVIEVFEVRHADTNCSGDAIARRRRIDAIVRLGRNSLRRRLDDRRAAATVN